MPTNSIGTAGRTYSTIAAWESATEIGPAHPGGNEIGEAYDDSDFSEVVSITGSTNTTASNRRILRAAAGHAYDPITDTGVNWTGNGSINGVCILNEAFVELGTGGGFRIANTATAGSVGSVACITGRLMIVARCYLEYTGANNNNNIGGLVCFGGGSTPDQVWIRSCAARGSNNGANTGMTWGFFLQGLTTGIQAGCRCHNCNAYDVNRGSGTGAGFNCNNDSDVVLRNDISIQSRTQDFRSMTGVGSNNCISSDSTAVGAQSHINQTAAGIWNNAAVDDYRIVSGSVAQDGGETLPSVFADITGVNHGTASGSWNIGSYDGVASAPPVQITCTISDSDSISANAVLRMAVTVTITEPDTLTPITSLGVITTSVINDTDTLSANPTTTELTSATINEADTISADLTEIVAPTEISATITDSDILSANLTLRAAISTLINDIDNISAETQQNSLISSTITDIDTISADLSAFLNILSTILDTDVISADLTAPGGTRLNATITETDAISADILRSAAISADISDIDSIAAVLGILSPVTATILDLDVVSADLTIVGEEDDFSGGGYVMASYYCLVRPPLGERGTCRGRI